jgi:hypothetical protein
MLVAITMSSAAKIFFIVETGKYWIDFAPIGAINQEVDTMPSRAGK